MVRSNSSRRRLLRRKKKSQEGEDRISTLPDSILQHILSFLPIKKAIETTLLSSRWKDVWASVPHLEFYHLPSYPKECEDKDIIISNDKRRFTNFVDRVLHVHNGSNVWRFTISEVNFANSWDSTHRHRLNSWITSALIKYKLQKLHISSTYLDYSDVTLEPYVFPSCLFESQSMMTLTSLTIYLKSTLHLPSFAHFPNLKGLYLSDLHLSADTQQAVFDIPLLEEFQMELLRMVDIKSFTVCAPKLKRLKIFDDVDHGDSQSRCEIKIHSRSAIFLHIHTAFLYDYSLILPSLVQAYVSVRGDATKLLKAISNVQDLTVEHIDFYCAEDPSHPITFPHLTNLSIGNNLNKLMSEHLLPIDKKDEEGMMSFQDLVRLLNFMPNLEFLEFTCGVLIDDDADWNFEKMPICLMSRLKSVKMFQFWGDLDDVAVVNFFLKNSRVLDRLTLKWVGDNDIVKISRKLLMIPRVSIQCVIDLSPLQRIADSESEL